MPLVDHIIVSDAVYAFLTSQGGDAGLATVDAPGLVILAKNGASVAGKPVQSNDVRLSNSRSPTAHASRHRKGGSDAIRLDDLNDPEDNTDLDATPSAHGLMSKNDKIKLDGISGSGNFSVVSVDPSAGDGANNDCRINMVNKKIHFKSGGTWTVIGYMLANVTDSQVEVVTPTAGTGTIEVATP